MPELLAPKLRYRILRRQGVMNLPADGFEVTTRPGPVWRSLGQEPGTDNSIAYWTVDAGVPTYATHVATMPISSRMRGGHADWTDLTFVVAFVWITGSKPGIEVHADSGANAVQFYTDGVSMFLVKQVGGVFTQVATLPLAIGLVTGTTYFMAIQAVGTTYTGNVFPAPAAGTPPVLGFPAKGGANQNAISGVIADAALQTGRVGILNGPAGVAAPTGVPTFGQGSGSTNQNVCVVTAPVPENWSTTVIAGEPAFCLSKVTPQAGTYSASISSAAAAGAGAWDQALPCQGGAATVSGQAKTSAGTANITAGGQTTGNAGAAYGVLTVTGVLTKWPVVRCQLSGAVATAYFDGVAVAATASSEITSQLDHPHRSTWTIRAMQPAAPAANAFGTFTIPLHPVGTEQAKANAATYMQLLPGQAEGLRVEAYRGDVLGGPPVFSGIVTGSNIDTIAGTWSLTGFTDTWIAHAQRFFPGETTSIDPSSGFYRRTVMGLPATHYYRLGEAVGAATAADELGPAGNGTFVNGPTLAIAGALAGEANTAATFASATSQKVTIAATTGFPTGAGAWSLEAWVNCAAFAANETVLAYGDFGVANGIALIGIDATGHPYVGGTAFFTAAAALTTGAWHHLVGTYDGVTLRLYVDGVLAASGAVTLAIPVPAATGRIGCRNTTAVDNAFFNGSIDEPAFYTITLIAGQVSANFAAGVTPVTGPNSLDRLKRYMAENVLSFADQFSPYVAGNYNMVQRAGYTLATLAAATDQNGVNPNVVKWITGGASNLGVFMISKTGLTAQDKDRTFYLELFARLTGITPGATGGPSINVGLAPQRADVLPQVAGSGTYPEGGGTIGTDGNSISGSTLTGLQDADGVITLHIQVVVNRHQTVTTINGQVLAATPGYDSANMTMFPYIDIWWQANGCVSTVYFTNFLAGTRLTAASGPAAPPFAIGATDTPAHSCGLAQPPPSTFLDAWSAQTNLEPWLWRYTPVAMGLGIHPTMGTVDAKVNPGVDRTAQIRFENGGNLAGIQMLGNAETFGSDIQMNGAGSLAQGGQVNARNIPAMIAFGWLSDVGMNLTSVEYNAFRLQAQAQVGAKGAPGGSILAKVNRDPITADQFRELDIVTLHHPELGFNNARVTVLAYTYTEGEGSQLLTLGQFSANDPGYAGKRAIPNAALMAGLFKSR